MAFLNTGGMFGIQNSWIAEIVPRASSTVYLGVGIPNTDLIQGHIRRSSVL
ncbi:MAG: hypothetical protein M1544_00475 [Candidatus Marsarchaeota archaeon]|nr:hypothetical protein [Candidatus Marsarchaeota archaeon]